MDKELIHQVTDVAENQCRAGRKETRKSQDELKSKPGKVAKSVPRRAVRAPSPGALAGSLLPVWLSQEAGGGSESRMQPFVRRPQYHLLKLTMFSKPPCQVVLMSG